MNKEEEENEPPLMNSEQMEAHEAQARKNAATMATNSLLCIQRLLAGELANVIDPMTGEKIADPDGRRITRIMELSKASESLTNTVTGIHTVPTFQVPAGIPVS